MIELDWDGLRRAPIGQDPFPHLIVPDFVPPASLDAVVGGLPALDKGGSYPIGSLQLGPAAAALMAALEGADFRALVAERFALDLTDAPTMVTLRGRSRERDGQIHCNSVAKRVTVLLYLNPDSADWARQDGCLRLLRGPGDLDDYAVEVPPVNGTLLVFPNTPNSWHGHRRFIGRRYVVQLNYMNQDRDARSELRRHRLSALVKRLTAAA